MVKSVFWFSFLVVTFFPSSAKAESEYARASLAEDISSSFECPIEGQRYDSEGNCSCPDGMQVQNINDIQKCVPVCPGQGQVLGLDGLCICSNPNEVLIDGVCQEGVCEYYSGSLSYCREADNSIAANLSGIQCNEGKSLKLKKAAKDLSCIDTVLKRCQARFPFTNINRSTVRSQYEYSGDDYMLLCFAEIADQSLKLPTGTTLNRFAQSLSATNWGQYGFYMQTSFVLDEKCNGVRLPKGEKVCGNVDVYAIVSPVSLLLDDSIDINLGQTVTDFPLELGITGAWYTWKASAKAPLLVFDPKRSGKITSSTQLFGKWTFGGQHLAALANSQLSPIPWEDGFQAMKSLDTNRDNALTGEELKDLALWFDNNQNGISEPGEVRSLSQEQIVKLYFTGATRSSSNPDLYLKLGHERLVNGKLVAGKSVDWYGEKASSPIEAALREQIRNFNRAENKFEKLSQNQHSDLRNTDTASDSTSKSKLLEDFVGTWNWQLTGESGYNYRVQHYVAKGIFTFSLKDGKLNGASIIESPTKDQNGEQYSQFAMFPMRGHFNSFTKEGPKISFETLGRNSITKNSAYLSKDKQLLLGESEYLVQLEDGKSKSLRYKWTAKKLQASISNYPIP